MPTFRIDEDGKFIPFEQRKAEELEEKVEAWLEANEHVLFAPEQTLCIGRQVRTDRNKAIDLLAIDAHRRPVVIELKKDRMPREMVAQALEYAAFIRKLDYDGLNSIAISYFGEHDQPWTSLEEAHADKFGQASDLDWNARQVVVLVGQTIQPEIVDVAQFLRAHDIDLRVMQLVYFESPDLRLVNVETVIGQEQLPSEASLTASAGTPLDEELEEHPAIRTVFERLTSELQTLGLHLTKHRTSLSFNLSSNPRRRQSLVNLWISTSGKAVFLLLGSQARSISDVDTFAEAVIGMGIQPTLGASNISIHISPEEVGKVPGLVKTVGEQFVTPWRTSQSRVQQASQD